MELKTENGILVDFEGLLKYAEQGNAEAQYNLALEYGKVEKNYIKMAEWLKKSAGQGFDKAECFLGICYFFGKGVRKSRKKAFELMEKSALAGNKAAEKTLEELKEY